VKVAATAIPDVLIFEPAIYRDARGHFLESFNQKNFEDAVGSKVTFVQDNQSHSRQGVLRGLHYQIEQAQGKLVRVLQGEIFDVAVDLRRKSPTFGQWAGVALSEENRKQIWLPPGLAHGFLVLSETADVAYKVTDYYAPQHERALLWNDPGIGIAWPKSVSPILSEKDRAATPLAQAEVFA
jgi:dTDP-4-dehydrorhamnose 3,5-epimerase